MRRVLVVDDNIAMAENIAEIIADTGIAAPVVANSGEQALELLEAAPFDVLITDVRMPGIDGVQLIERAHDIDPELPVAIMTAFAGCADLARAKQRALLGVISKPFSMTTLLNLLEKAQRGRPILIVEKNHGLAEKMADALRACGLATVTCHSLACLERVRETPCVAIVDVRVAGEADGGVLTRVSERFPDAAILLTTASRYELEPPAALPIFEKPFDLVELVAFVESRRTPRRRPRPSAKSLHEDPEPARKGPHRVHHERPPINERRSS